MLDLDRQALQDRSTQDKQKQLVRMTLNVGSCSQKNNLVSHCTLKAGIICKRICNVQGTKGF